MNTIKALAKNWWVKTLTPEERNAIRHKNPNIYNINNKTSFSDAYENIFYNEVIVKWWDNLDASKMGDYLYHLRDGMDAMEDVTKTEIFTLYLKEHTKEQPKEEYVCYKCQNKTNNKFEICDSCNIGWIDNTQISQEQSQSVDNTIDVEETEEQEDERILNQAFLDFNKYCKQPSNCRQSLSKKCICPKPKTEDNIWNEAQSNYFNSENCDNDVYQLLRFLKQHYSLIKK